MIELKKEELMKNRGYSATLSAGYHLLADNFKAISRHIWPYALALALVLGLWTVMTGDVNNAEVTPLFGIELFGCLVVMLVVYMAFYARATMLLNGQSMRWNVGRTTKLLGFGILAGIVVSLVIVALVFLTAGGAGIAALAPAEGADPEAIQPEAVQGMAQSLLVMVGTIVLVVIFFLPFYYTVMKYLVETEGKLFPTVLGCYGRGLRYWGYIFVCTLLLGLCIGVCSIILMLPLYVVQTVQHLNQVGMLGGDESGLPAWFAWLIFGVSAVTYFVYAFVCLIQLFVSYYIYGSIETRIRERRQLTAPEE